MIRNRLNVCVYLALAVLFVVGFFDFASAAEKRHESTASINSADATNIVLKNIRKLVDGDFPRFSPDGRQILFNKKIQKKGLEKIAIMVMDVNGKNKKILLEDGQSGVWSPDGRKIAYCGRHSGSEYLFVYDIKANEKFPLLADCSAGNLGWFKDGKSISLGGDEMFDLDTLKQSRVEKVFCGEDHIW